MKIKCISLWQPWASAVVTPHPTYPGRGIKEFETRHWTNSVRGRVLVHAAKKWDAENRSLFIGNPGFEEYRGYIGEQLPLGFLVGSVEILDVITSEKFIAEGPELSKTPRAEFHLGNWGHNRYGWKLGSPILFDKPIPWRGQQGFWEIEVDELPADIQPLFRL